jgi:beta-galactosidase
MMINFMPVQGQEVHFDPSDWQNPAVFQKNQMPPHALIIPYASEKTALSGNPAGSPWYRSLDGVWKFLLVDNPSVVPGGFYKPGYTTEGWNEIRVPSNWEMEGFGYPKFRNIAMTIDTKPPFVPVNDNPTGCYKRTFRLPLSWEKRVVLLRFEGVKSASCVWVNGHPAGYNEGGFEPAEYDITSLIRPGENDLSVQVMRYCDGSFLENQDMWRLSGIFRSVSLFAVPQVYLHDYYVVTDLDDQYRDATLQVETDILNRSGKMQPGYIVETTLLDEMLKPVFLAPATGNAGMILSGENKTIKIAVPVKDPQKWSAEKPNLYTLLLTLKDQSGKIKEVIAKKIGFREVEIHDQAIFINGKAVKFNGVNSHMHHPEHGQAVPAETLRKDLTLMKQFNINTVRTCHYPPSPEYLDLADELGMYIFDETGDECHDNEYLSADPAWRAMFEDRAQQLVYRDRNHPSVVVWSAGNEAGEGENIKAVIETGKRIDPSRPGWMYGGNTFYIPFEDIVGPRYWRPLEIRNLAEGKVLPPGDNRPSFQDEYLAATGNGLGGLDEYWEQIWKYPRLTGGAIWDWISPGIKVPLVFTPDDSPGHHDPVIMGRPQFVEGRNGKALKLSGNDDWVEFYRDPELDLAGNSLTVEFWVNPNEIRQPNTFISKSTHQFGILQPNTKEVEFYIYTNRRNTVKVNIPENWYGNWHHVAGIYDGKSIALYVDFQKAGESPCSGNMLNAAYPVCIGRDAELHDQGEHHGLLSSCLIDDVRIYMNAMSVNDLKNQPPGQASSNALISLGFEEKRVGESFFSTGLGGRSYGIIWPDRTIQPEIYQIKKSAQPVLIEAFDLNRGVFKITNRFNFTDLDELETTMMITSGKDTVGMGGLMVSCLPGKQTTLKIPVSVVSGVPGKDSWLTFSIKLKEDKSWAKKGHEVAWEQFLMPAKTMNENPGAGLQLLETDKSPNPVKIEKTDKEVILTGEDFRYVMDSGSGLFHSIRFKGTEMVVTAPRFAIWRAPLANDMDPWGSDNFNRMHFTPGLGRSIENQLRTLGLEKLTPEVDSIKISQGIHGEAHLHMLLFTPGNAGRSGFEHHQDYIISGDGTITLHCRIIPQGDMPGLLPRSGMEFLLPESLNKLEWYGRGPFETYPDRKTGAKMGIWNSTIDDAHVPYLIPQDYGNKTDVRWVKISNNSGAGFEISSNELLNFSLHAFSTDNLTRAVYPFQLKKPGFNTLNIDWEVSGVGETARRTLTKYRIFPGVKEYDLVIKPYTSRL